MLIAEIALLKQINDKLINHESTFSPGLFCFQETGPSLRKSHCSRGCALALLKQALPSEMSVQRCPELLSGVRTAFLWPQDSCGSSLEHQCDDLVGTSPYVICLCVTTSWIVTAATTADASSTHHMRSQHGHLVAHLGLGPPSLLLGIWEKALALTVAHWLTAWRLKVPSTPARVCPVARDSNGRRGPLVCRCGWC